jgi:hypothetical protein
MRSADPLDRSSCCCRLLLILPLLSGRRRLQFNALVGLRLDLASRD